MGGAVPLGYEARDKKLVIKPEEAEIIRRIFRHYLEAGSVRRLKERLDTLVMVTKVRGQAAQATARIRLLPVTMGRFQSSLNQLRASGGKPFTRGHIYWLLTNPIYVGDIRHKEYIVTGQHEGIIDRKLWEAVQLFLKDRGNRNRGRAISGTGVFLLGSCSMRPAIALPPPTPSRRAGDTAITSPSG